MKLKRHITHAMGTLLLLAALSSCEKEKVTKELPDATKEWIKVTHNSKIHFVSNTGEQEELTVTIKEDKLIKIHGTYQWIKVMFKGQQENLGFAINAEGNFADFINRAEDDFERDYVTVVTYDDAAEEYLTPFGVDAAELLYKHSINGKEYERMLHVVFSPSTERENKIRELYYARTEGIVSFVTTDDKVWLRQ